MFTDAVLANHLSKSYLVNISSSKLSVNSSFYKGLPSTVTVVWQRIVKQTLLWDCCHTQLSLNGTPGRNKKRGVTFLFLFIFYIAKFSCKELDKTEHKKLLLNHSTAP